MKILKLQIGVKTLAFLICTVKLFVPPELTLQNSGMIAVVFNNIFSNPLITSFKVFVESAPAIYTSLPEGDCGTDGIQY